MEISIKRSLDRTDMVISGQEGASSSDDSLQMVVQNQIPFLLPVQYEEIDSQVRLVYDISSRLPLTQCLEGARLSRQDMTGLVRGIGACSKKLQEYLLDPKLLILRADCIYMDPGRKDYLFCYDPFYEGSQQKDLQGLFERIIACIDYEDPELVRMTYEMFSAVQEENVQWRDVEAVLHKNKERPDAVIRDFYSGNGAAQVDPAQFIKTDEPDPRPARYRELRRSDPYEDESDRRHDGEEHDALWRGGWDRDPGRERAEAKAGFLPNLRRYLKKHNIREVLTDIDDGLILQKIHDEAAEGGQDDGSEPQRRHALEGVGEQAKEYIELVRFPFYIGKLEGKSDYILDRDTVSRNHLCICKDPQMTDCCLIIDQKSRNGTYLNGKRIHPMVKERVREGDHIRLADAEFVFR